MNYLELIINFLPPTAELLSLGRPTKRPAILFSDLDGDGSKEIAAAYKFNKENYILIIKNCYGHWFQLANLKGTGNNMFQLTQSGLKNIVLNATLSKIEMGAKYYQRKAMKYSDEAIMSQHKMRIINLYPAILKSFNGNNWGFIDSKGEFIIKPKYDYAMDFQNNGLAVVEKNNLQGLIDSNGDYIIEPKYESISQFCEGLANVADDRGFKVIDRNGTILTTKAYGYISSYKENRAMFANNVPDGKYLYGYLDKHAKEIIPLKYESATDFNNGKALVKIKENEYALIDLDGVVLKSYKHYFLGPLSDGMLAFSEGIAKKYGYINESGKVIIPPKYTSALPFVVGRAVVNTAENFMNKYGLIDKNDNSIISAKYNQINFLGENRFAVGKAIDESKSFLGSKFSIADMNGNFLTTFIYNDVSEYKDGFASAYDNINTFFIDKTGKVAKILPIVKGNGSLTFDGTLIKALIDSRLSYLDKAGNVIYIQNKVIQLDNKYTIIDEKYKPIKDYLVYYPKLQGMKHKTTQTNVNEKLKSLSLVKPISNNLQLDYSYFGDFSVEFNKKSLLVLRLDGYNFPYGAAHGMPTKIYPNINLINGKFYELKDLFKQNSNYIKVLSDIIGKQIKDNPEYSYVFPDSYKGITLNQPFYVKGDSLYIYFTPYEIAPYAAGFPTFRIPFIEIMIIINTDGEFWRSFH